MREQRLLRKRWRTVHIDSATEQSLLQQHRNGCQKLRPQITWGDARLEHREPYGAWRPSRPQQGIEYDDAISGTLYAQQNFRDRHVHFAVPTEEGRAAETTTTNTSPEARTSHRRSTYQWFKRPCTTPSQDSKDEKELARQWAAFDYVPQSTYVSVWDPPKSNPVKSPPPRGPCSVLKRLLRRLTQQGSRCGFKAKAPPQPRFKHAHPFDPSPWPPLPPFGSKQYTSGTVGADALTTDDASRWMRTNLEGRHPSRTLLYAADSWMVGK
jgi:hypothetical protein